MYNININTLRERIHLLLYTHVEGPQLKVPHVWPAALVVSV